MALSNDDKYSARDYIYIVCKQAVYIKQLRMSGPIIAPLKVQMATAWQIVCSGVKLYQYNPATKEFVLMTVENAWYKTKFTQSVTNKPSLLTETASTMSLRSESVVEDDDDDDDDDQQKPVTQNSSNSNKKKKNKNKQQNNNAQNAAVVDVKAENPKVEAVTEVKAEATEAKVEEEAEKAE